MQDMLQNPETLNRKPRSSSTAVALAAVVTLAVVAGLWLLFGPLKSAKAPSTGSLNLQMSPAEQEYRKKIEIGNLAFSRAENFIHQEVTIMSGEVFNGGTEVVSGLRITAEFSNDMDQVVLRETRGVLETSEMSLAPGERRAFEISFDHMPNSWNMQRPAVRVEYLRLPSRK
jgi:hypothetical protein